MITGVCIGGHWAGARASSEVTPLRLAHRVQVPEEFCFRPPDMPSSEPVLESQVELYHHFNLIPGADYWVADDLINNMEPGQSPVGLILMELTRVYMMTHLRVKGTA